MIYGLKERKSYLVGVKWHTLNAENIKKNPAFTLGSELLKKIWSGRKDSNLRHLGPKPSTLPD